MRSNVIKELLLYRYRYVLGYALLVFLGVGLTVWQLADIPPGFSALEKQSAVISNQLTTGATTFTNLPYHMLQKGTLALFGPSAWGIRLPSIVAGLLIAAAAYFLIRRWFGESTAIIGAVLVVTSVYFLLRARSGNPLVLYYLWPALLLLTASMAYLQHYNWRGWILAFAAIAALSLYTPYLGFLLIIIVLAALASRQGRSLLAELGSPTIVLSVFIFAVLLFPLGYSIYANPQTGLAYVGITETPGLAFVLERLKSIIATLTGIGAGSGFYPVLSIPALALSFYGLFYTLLTVSRTRYAIAALWLLTTIALYVSTEQVPVAILFVPIALLIVIGFHRFIQQWYQLFPRNPYARVTALLPIALLLFVIVQFNYQRYFYALPRSENVRSVYDGDILLVNEALAAGSRVGTAVLIVPPSERAFFSLLEGRHRLLRVTSVDSTDAQLTGNDVIIAESELGKLSVDEKTVLAERDSELVVDDRPGNDALRFRIYR